MSRFELRPEDEDRLLDLAVGGQSHALHELMLHRYDSLVAFATSLTASAPTRATLDAEDIVQEAFAKMFMAINAKGFHAPTRGAVVEWMRTVVRNVFIDQLRRGNRSAEGGQPEERLKSEDDGWGAEWLSQIAATNDPRASETARRKELIRAYELATEDLSEEYALVLRLHYIDGKSYEEVGELLGKTPGAVRAIAGRACKKVEQAIVRLSIFV